MFAPLIYSVVYTVIGYFLGATTPTLLIIFMLGMILGQLFSLNQNLVRYANYIMNPLTGKFSDVVSKALAKSKLEKKD